MVHGWTQPYTINIKGRVRSLDVTCKLACTQPPRCLVAAIDPTELLAVRLNDACASVQKQA